MQLPDEEFENERSGLSIPMMTAIIFATAVILGIIIIVFLTNTSDTKKKPSLPPKSALDSAAELQSPILPEHGEEDAQIEPASGLHPDDLDFWDKYPAVEESTGEATEIVEETSREEEENSIETDGNHTCITYEDGSTEWLLISPYLPANPYDFTGLVCQSGIMKYYEDGKKVSHFGVDISKYQDYVDFGKLKKAGVEYVMIRVGARGYGTGQLVMDEYFLDNCKRATDAGLEIGLYFFSQAISEEEAVEEANMVLESIGDYEVNYPIAFDMEYIKNDESRIEQLTKTQKTDIAKKFMDTIKEAGYVPMLYGSKEWLLKQVDISKLTAYDIWLSQNEDIPDYPYQFTMWQYDTQAMIDGIAGYADLNISFIDYSEK